MKKRIISALLSAAMIVTCFAACGKEDQPEVIEQPVDVAVVTETPAADAAVDPAEFFNQVSSDGKVRSYLTGEWVAEEIGRSRPFALMVENTKDCLPQYGLSKAGIIYECPVEGSITRMMAIFDDYTGMDRIGNVRSSRPYFVYFASEYEAFYGHAGGNPAAFDLIDQGLVENLNGLDGDLTPSMYFRAKDSSAPHNLYCTSDGIAAGIKARNYDTNYSSSYEPKHLFCDESNPNMITDGSNCEVVKLYYYYNHPYWVYNSEDGLYYRYEFGKAQIDANTGEQISAKNIILQNAEWFSYTGSDYIGFFLNDYTGNGLYFTNGRACEITWTKGDENSTTRYYDSNGEELKINVGQTWVQLCQADCVEDNEYYETVAEFEKASK
ncbi:MAG: DUF3048 domain-containing protein [Pseudobutyrivibrio sp.]|nr:DUF3048 domain-containing protein [Pseudobutyrivibrio sp.]